MLSINSDSLEESQLSQTVFQTWSPSVAGIHVIYLYAKIKILCYIKREGEEKIPFLTRTVFYTSKSFTNGKTNYPTKFAVFDLDGNYLKTLETGYPVIIFYYDKGNNRILMSLNDEMQFTYLDVIN